MTVDVQYKKNENAKEIQISIRSPQPMTLLDVVRALTSIVSQILNTGKY